MSSRGFSDQPALLTVRHTRRQELAALGIGVFLVLLGSVHLVAAVFFDGYRDQFDDRMWMFTVMMVLVVPVVALDLARGRQPVVARLTQHGIERRRRPLVPWSDCIGVSHAKSLRFQTPFVRIHRRGRQSIRLYGLFECGTAAELVDQIAKLTGLPNLGYRLIDFAPGSVDEAS